MRTSFLLREEFEEQKQGWPSWGLDESLPEGWSWKGEEEASVGKIEGGHGSGVKRFVILKLKKKIIKDISEEVYDVKGEYSSWMDGEKLNQSMGSPKREA